MDMSLIDFNSLQSTRENDLNRQFPNTLLLANNSISACHPNNRHRILEKFVIESVGSEMDTYFFHGRNDLRIN